MYGICEKLPIMMFCGLPVIVAVEPMFDAIATASRYGTGLRRIAAYSSSTSGASTRQIASLTRNAEKTPEVATTAHSKRKAAWRASNTQALAIAKKPDRRRLATTIIMPSKQGERVEVDRLVGILKRQRARCDHQAGTDQSDAGPVDAQARNPADRERQITSDEDDDGCDFSAVPT